MLKRIVVRDSDPLSAAVEQSYLSEDWVEVVNSHGKIVGYFVSESEYNNLMEDIQQLEDEVEQSSCVE